MKTMQPDNGSGRSAAFQTALADYARGAAQAPEGVDPKAFLEAREHEINHIVYDAVAEFGGSISAEHGIGTLKAETLPQYQSPVALGMMRAIKKALDPQGIMNPNCMIAREL